MLQPLPSDSCVLNEVLKMDPCFVYSWCHLYKLQGVTLSGLQDRQPGTVSSVKVTPTDSGMLWFVWEYVAVECCLHSDLFPVSCDSVSEVYMTGSARSSAEKCTGHDSSNALLRVTRVGCVRVLHQNPVHRAGLPCTGQQQWRHAELAGGGARRAPGAATRRCGAAVLVLPRTFRSVQHLVPLCRAPGCPGPLPGRLGGLPVPLAKPCACKGPSSPTRPWLSDFLTCCIWCMWHNATIPHNFRIVYN